MSFDSVIVHLEEYKEIKKKRHTICDPICSLKHCYKYPPKGKPSEHLLVDIGIKPMEGAVCHGGLISEDTKFKSWLHCI